MKKLLVNTAKYLLFLLPLIVIFSLSLKGSAGSPTSETINSAYWIEQGPFELSPERGRFALLYSFIEDKSFYFSIPIAKFATPDLGYKNNNYVSLFAPFVSFISIPGYHVGKYLGGTQIGTFATIAVFAIINAHLILDISKMLSVKRSLGILAALLFLFGSPAFAYGSSYYQHHISTFFVLISIYSLYKWDNWKSLAVIWFSYICAFGVDYPNLFIMFPLMIVVLLKVINIVKGETNIDINIKYLNILPIFAVIIPLVFLMWFNKNSYDNYFQMSGTVKSVGDIDVNTGLPIASSRENYENVEEYIQKANEYQSDLNTFFETRAMLNGFYILLFSPDRGVITFAPMVFVSIVGMYFAYKNQMKYLQLLVSIMLFNIMIYAMWGDVWGGWAFGSRYLLPTYAISAIFVAYGLSKISGIYYYIALTFLLGIFAYSSYVNTAGALTSNANPPKVEVLALEKISGREEKYSFNRNVDQVKENKLKSFVYTTKAKDVVSGMNYFYIVYGITVVTFFGYELASISWRKKNV